MNSLRSSERSLTLIAFKNCESTTKTRRNVQTKSFSVFCSEKRSYTKTSRKFLGYNHVIKTAKVRVKDTTQTRLFSTGPLANKPFLNPNKPTAEDAKSLCIQPIVPLTLPRFPKSLRETSPSVTKILQDTMPAASRFLLDRWKESMIKKLGTEGFSQYQKETFERGRALHALLANYLLGHGEPTAGQGELSTEIVTKLWMSIQKVVKEKISNVRLVEHIVTHPDMKYRGIVDCVAFYEDELVVIDFKTAEKPKKNVESLFDNPLQVTAYCGAINNDATIPLTVIDRNIWSGLVIVAYIDGSEASTYLLKRDQVISDYWKQWTSRLDQYTQLEEIRQRENKKNPFYTKKL